MEDEKNMSEIDEAYDDTVDDVDIEEVSDEPSQDDKKKTKKKRKKDKRPRKPLSRNSKIVIILVSICLLIAILATSIAVPINIANKDKIFVGSAGDFANTNGTHYVLTDDVHVTENLTIGKINNINFNGYTLTVDGVLTIDNKSDKDVIIGMGDNTGTLQATSINIKSDSDVIIKSLVKADKLDVVAPNLIISNGVSLVDNSTIKAGNVTILDNVEFADNTRENMLTFVDVGNININARIGGNLYIKNNLPKVVPYPCKAYITGDIFGDILADANVSVTVDSKITGKIDSYTRTVVEDTPMVTSKVGRVILGNNAFVKEIFNTTSLLLYPNARYQHITAVDNRDFVRQLERVGYITVKEVGKSVMLYFAPVLGADNYKVTVGDHEPINVAVPVLAEGEVPATTMSCDITAYIDTKAVNRITIQAESLSSATTLEASKPSIYEYRTFMTLAEISNISVTNVSGKNMLTFNEVPFAEEYIISINGKTFKSRARHDVDVHALDVTKYINDAGSYIVEIVANSRNENIKPSKPVYYKYDIHANLGAVNLTIASNHPNMTLSWNAVKGARLYEVIMVGEDESENIIYTTIDTKFATTVGQYDGYNIRLGQRFKVRAISDNPYLNSSTSGTVIFEIV